MSAASKGSTGQAWEGWVDRHGDGHVMTGDGVSIPVPARHAQTISSAANERAGLLSERDALAARVAELTEALAGIAAMLAKDTQERHEDGGMTKLAHVAVAVRTVARAALSGGKGGAA